MRKGFTLLELSIVLVILGLLAGGVLAGQALIRAAELRAVGTEHTSFITGINVFRDKYFALPGDFTNAGAVWGLVNTGICGDAPSTDKKTCNGNGNGMIEIATALNPTDGAISYGTNEGSYFWKQLANVELTSGPFDNMNPYNPSKFSAAYWVAVSFPATSSNGFVFVTRNGSSQPLLPEDALNLDIKLDDGKPLSGAIQGWVSNTSEGIGACINGTSYNATATTPGCSLNFLQRF